MKKKQIPIEHLLPDYFSGELSDENLKIIENWINASNENKADFREISTVWESGAILEQMQQFNSTEALNKVNRRLKLEREPAQIWQKLQKIAAILLLPLLIYSGYLTFQRINGTDINSSEIGWQVVKTTTGMLSELTLPDGSHVWLNSESSIEYPVNFKKTREVNLKGEAYFEVKKDKRHPFVVNTGKINVEVLGTSFNVNSYPSEIITEVALKSGKVQLFTGDIQHKKDISFLSPNQCASFNNENRKLTINNVPVEKYMAWKDGVLMFDNDPMNEVTKKLSRWFNVEFILENEELKEYVYKATFKNETLDQILELLKISAPIEYKIIPRETLANGNFSKKKIMIRKKQI